jgi:RNA polymerase sigma-70 factor (ECF subfamily)
MAVTEAGHHASRAIDALYRRHGPEVYRYAYAVLGNHADAEDVTQTTFLNAYRALEQGVHPRKPSNWLLTIASNAIKQRFRQEQSRPRTVELDDRIARTDIEEDGPSVGELLTALSKIPPQQRQSIVLREFEGRSYAEIAEILGVTTSALETLLFRARRSIAEELEHQLTCTDAQLAISKSVDGRLGRKERRRLRDHLAECPDCAHFARLQQRHRSALRGLMLIPIPLSLTLFKGLEGAGTASAATLPAAAGVGAATAASGLGAGAGTATATGGGLFAGGVAIKAVAAVAAVSIAGGVAVTGASNLENHPAKKAPAATKPGVRLGHVAPRGVTVPGNGVARGKPSAHGQVKKASATSKRHARTHAKQHSHPTSSSHGQRVSGAKRVAGTKRVAGAKRANTSTPKQSSTGQQQSTKSPTQTQTRTNQPSAETKSSQGTGKGHKSSGETGTEQPSSSTPSPTTTSPSNSGNGNSSGNGHSSKP